MPSPLANIRSIIFDLGNVIVDIDYMVMVNEFKKIAVIDFSDMVNYSRQDNIFNQFEKGSISVPDFRCALRKYLKEGVTDAEIDAAWNSIITAYPPAKFDMLTQLRKEYKTYALSNINELHVALIEENVQKRFGAPNLRSYFDQVYYSNETGYRKPEPEIYKLVLDNERLIPSETLFIDDKAENIEAAAALGIKTLHLTDRDALLELLGF